MPEILFVHCICSGFCSKTLNKQQKNKQQMPSEMQETILLFVPKWTNEQNFVQGHEQNFVQQIFVQNVVCTGLNRQQNKTPEQNFVQQEQKP